MKSLKKKLLMKIIEEKMNYYKKAYKKAKRRQRKLKNVSISNYTLYKIFKELVSVYENLNFKDIGFPPEHIDSDLTFVGDPKKIKEAEDKINLGNFNYLKNAKSQGPFLNIYLKEKIIFNEILSMILKLTDSYGTNNENKNQTVLIEYSSPNIAKPIGIGHLRSTVIGQVLSNMYEANGSIVIRDNYLGDWGTQFGKVIYAYKAWGKDLEVNIKNLKSLYVKFQKESEQNEELIDKAREILKDLEKGDKELKVLWKKIKDISIKEFKEVYYDLGVNFDNYGGESFFLDKARDISERCLSKGIAKKGERGASVVEIDDLPTFILQKGDGSTIYHSRDLAQLKTRIDELNPKEVIYVVGNEQKLHFKQLFKLAEKLDYLKETKPKHISFGLVLGANGKKMSTRQGTSVELKNFIEEAVEKSYKTIEEKNSNLEKKEKKDISKKVGVGAIIYNDISQTRTKDILFNWDRMLDFESGSASYLQYTYVRIKSIFEKYNEEFGKPKRIKEFIFEEKIEKELIKKMMFFPQVIKISKETDSPHMIANYLEELAGLFNTFYNKVSITKTEDKNLRLSRLYLSNSVSYIISNGLNILNIPIPEKM